MICSLNQVWCVLFALFSELLVDLVSLGRRESIGIRFVVLGPAGWSLWARQRANGSRPSPHLDIVWLCFFHDRCWLMNLSLLWRGLLLLPRLSRGAIWIVSKEIHVLCLVHKVGLVSLYDRHIIDGLLIDRFLLLHTLVEKSIWLVNCVGIIVGLASTESAKIIVVIISKAR